MEEPRIIEELHNLLDFELDDKVYELSLEQSQRVKEAREEYLSGNVLSEQQANEEIKQWLNAK